MSKVTQPVSGRAEDTNPDHLLQDPALNHQAPLSPPANTSVLQMTAPVTFISGVRRLARAPGSSHVTETFKAPQLSRATKPKWSPR